MFEPLWAVRLVAAAQCARRLHRHAPRTAFRGLTRRHATRYLHERHLAQCVCSCGVSLPDATSLRALRFRGAVLQKSILCYMKIKIIVNFSSFIVSDGKDPDGKMVEISPFCFQTVFRVL